MVRPILGLRIVFTGQADQHWGSKHLDLRLLASQVGAYATEEWKAKLAGVDVIIDVGGLRPGLCPDYIHGIGDALSVARSVTIQGTDESCAAWLREQLQQAAA